MNNGKQLCDKLRDIRKAIAAANGIEYNPTECHHKGDCPGTCPVCDAELQSLNAALQQKITRGESVNIPDDIIDTEIIDTEIIDTNLRPVVVDEMLSTQGIIPPPDDDDEYAPLVGDIDPRFGQIQGDILTPEQMIEREGKRKKK